MSTIVRITAAERAAAAELESLRCLGLDPCAFRLVHPDEMRDDTDSTATRRHVDGADCRCECVCVENIDDDDL